MTFMELVENFKLILETLSLLGGIFAVLYALPFFKYKIGTEERKLYLDNANKVREVLGFVYQNARIDDVNIAKLGIALNEASLYLNRDIVVFIDEIHKDLIRLFVIQLKLEKLEVGEERTKLCKEMDNILVGLGDCASKSIAIYRKHIVHEPMGKFVEVIEHLKSSHKRKAKGN